MVYKQWPKLDISRGSWVRRGTNNDHFRMRSQGIGLYLEATSPERAQLTCKLEINIQKISNFGFRGPYESAAKRSQLWGNQFSIPPNQNGHKKKNGSTGVEGGRRKSSRALLRPSTSTGNPVHLQTDRRAEKQKMQQQKWPSRAIIEVNVFPSAAVALLDCGELWEWILPFLTPWLPSSCCFCCLPDAVVEEPSFWLSKLV